MASRTLILIVPSIMSLLAPLDITILRVKWNMGTKCKRLRKRQCAVALEATPHHPELNRGKLAAYMNP